MTRLWLGLSALAVGCAVTLAGCGDDDDGGAADAGLDGGGARDGGAGRGGTGGRVSLEDGGGGTGGDAGPDSGTERDAGDRGDEDAGSVEEAVATAFLGALDDAGVLLGLAEFTQTGDGEVTLVIVLDDCPDGIHTVYIHEGERCADETAIGLHWDGLRGEGIPAITCAQDEGSLVYTREPSPDETAWSVGGDAASDILGRVLVVYDAAGEPVACGPIELAP